MPRWPTSFGSDRGQTAWNAHCSALKAVRFPRFGKSVQGSSLKQRLNKDYKLTIDDLQQAVVEKH